MDKYHYLSTDKYQLVKHNPILNSRPPEPWRRRDGRSHLGAGQSHPMDRMWPCIVIWWFWSSLGVAQQPETSAGAEFLLLLFHTRFVLLNWPLVELMCFLCHQTLQHWCGTKVYGSKQFIESSIQSSVARREGSRSLVAAHHLIKAKPTHISRFQ
jgi:hypothetical protein